VSCSREIPGVIRVLEFECDTSSIPSPACECDVALNPYRISVFYYEMIGQSSMHTF